MAQGITNVSGSLNTQRNLQKSTQAVGRNFEQLSSGKRINRASDDPAGLAIAESLLSEARTSAVAARNISDGVSAANIADGALESAANITGRLGELAAQASNGTLSDEQRSALNNEYQALRSELDRVSQTTEFNGQQLLSGGSNIQIQSGTDGGANSRIALSLPGVSSSSLGLTSDISTQAGAQQSLDQAKAATESIAQARGSIGATVSRLGTAFENVRVSEDNQREAESRIRDADIADTAGRLTAAKIRQQGSAALLSQQNSADRQTVLKLLT